MNPQTVGRGEHAGRSIPIECIRGDRLKDLDIKDQCFLLTIVHEGYAKIQVGETTVEAMAPCLLCFDESQSPRLIKGRGLQCDSIYFKPTFLNVNMTFSGIRSPNYVQIAMAHDFFLLEPFTDTVRYELPVFDEALENFERLFFLLEQELLAQSDWYWSCRCRSYFIELMLLLERTYALAGQAEPFGCAERGLDRHLKKALYYIENNYRNAITLEGIVKAASSNRSTLTQLFKQELEMTPIEYVWHHRLVVAKKLLEFTDLPIKDVSVRCGFRTVPHFCRRFEARFGDSPSAFREQAVAERKKRL